MGTDARDEIGQLSPAFDRMGKNLKKVTASRNELDAAGRMRRLINDLLTFTRVTTRGESFKPTDLETVARGEYEGTGVGLAVCRRILQRHDGTITGESAPDEGATFIITLPVQHPEAEESPQVVAASPFASCGCVS